MSKQHLTKLESQISSLKHELELATFLNKGILQTNTEYKLRIAELESENEILSKAESKLSKTEDELEVTQKQYRTLQGDHVDLLNAHNSLLRGHNELKDEVRLWQDRYQDLRKRIKSLLDNGQVDVDVDVEGDGQSKRNSITPITKSRATSASASVSVLAKRRTNAIPRNQEDQTKIASSSKVPLSVSPVLPPLRSQSKKRRRVEDSVSDQESGDEQIDQGDHEDHEDRYHSHNLHTPSPKNAYSSRTKYHDTIRKPTEHPNATPKTNGKPRSSTTSMTNRRKTNNQNKSNAKVKDEPISPGSGRRDNEDTQYSDDGDDPLAMM
ncbi:hypothetical protein I203_103463 [Kwoniella mangroviensis CBS 8507]|uniref:uncharacterized protein n=1 Tax=Kwoniella mangroviensis CBS 8507 TaxID=1296122 RepID=UPI00080D13BE|nr:uncharacterized protein I203_06166 [Kwoniella mangroviensis CBS 8507]OCF64921.1 hypothetical protein I203_06166 [Kwoniella mangroviensis CBS 8507]